MNEQQKSTEHFESFLPKGQKWFSAKEMAYIIGKTPQYIRDAFDNQKILGHTYNGRSPKGKEQRKSYKIPRENVLLFLLETANYEPDDFIDRINEILCQRTPSQLLKIQKRIDNILQGSKFGF